MEAFAVTKTPIAIASLFACLAVQAATASDSAPLQTNQVKLSVVGYDDHVQIECTPQGAETASRGDWRAICNEMAVPQVSRLVADGVIVAIDGPVFDLAAGQDAALLRRLARAPARL